MVMCVTPRIMMIHLSSSIQNATWNGEKIQFDVYQSESKIGKGTQIGKTATICGRQNDADADLSCTSRSFPIL